MGVGMFPTDDDDGVQLSFQLFRFQRLEMERLELVMGRTRGGGGGERPLPNVGRVSAETFSTKSGKT